MKLSVCIDAVFNKQETTESMRQLHQIGISAFEFWGWWDKDIQKIRQVKEELDMEVTTFCTKFVSLVDASQRGQYLEGLSESIEVAKLLGCNQLISQVGNDMGFSRGLQKQNLIDGLKQCVPILKKEDITLVIEPLNTLVDHQGYFLSSSEEAFDIIDAVGSPNVNVLYDIYHQQIMEGNIISRITNNIDKIGHFHAAGNPGRHELYYGEINYHEIFKAIENTNYNGYMGLEYFPVDNPIKGIMSCF